jgi:hypothetical protein
MQGEALEIIQRLVVAHPEGKLFRNRRGLPWSKFAVCNRFYRLSQKTGKRMFCYAARHGFATRKLIQGEGSPYDQPADGPCGRFHVGQGLRAPGQERGLPEEGSGRLRQVLAGALDCRPALPVP